ncbi:hypothetical protein R3P38DRAFT_2843009 [Favolaschia claudopus]|uniref:Uncharacterized protein n=1 Tax=Favolaschia claudopus TaxID=2862362 RepID=A0AAW0E201_9AGAR
MNGLDITATRTSVRSNDELSSLGDLDDGLNFGRNTPTDAPHDPRNDAETGGNECDADAHESVYAHAYDPDEVQDLVNDATTYTSRLIEFFIHIAAELNTPDIAKNGYVCTAIDESLKAIPYTMVIPTKFVPPEESSWRTKRQALEVSICKNIRKYIRFSDHLLRKPPRVEKFQSEINKLHSFAEKFSDLNSKFEASNDKIRLMELCENYEKMKLLHLEEQRLRESIRADRVARKNERALIRQQRQQQRHPT